MQFDKTPEESAAIGRKIYEGIRAEMEANHQGCLVVIDINSGDYEVGKYEGDQTDIELTKQLFKRRPNADTWAEPVGFEPYSTARLSWRQTMEFLAEQERKARD